MDWNAAIERNREALKRILASLVAMAGLGWRGQFTFFPQEDARPQDLAQAEKSKSSPALTLPRHLHRAVLRLLRPAEAAVRRLIIVMARGLVVTLPPARPIKPKPKPTILRNGVGTGIIMPRNAPGRPLRAARLKLSLPLLDPLRMPRRRKPPRTGGVPRISGLGFTQPFPVVARNPPSPDDPLSATRLALRLQGLVSALDDLPGQAERFARWQARRAATAGALNEKRQALSPGPAARRRWPLKPGHPPGWRRKPVHEVHDVLNVLHGLALWALESPDTS